MFVLVAFICLLIAGLYLQELDWRDVGLAVLILVAGMIVLSLFRLPPMLFTALVAILDAVLVVKVFKGDLRI
jgi:hypothetical protein